jgi:hypothetical protein
VVGNFRRELTKKGELVLLGKKREVNDAAREQGGGVGRTACIFY